jgi:predicted RNA-binding protein associated with RNAse of E/G family
LNERDAPSNESERAVSANEHERGIVAAGDVEIHYTRPPGRITVFRQRVVQRTQECIVTLLEHTELRRPVTVRDAAVLEPGAPVVWFTFPGRWHDIGRFHTAAGRFTGFYANVLTPVQFITSTRWETTDLFLDVWLDELGTELLDVDELDAALSEGAVTPGHGRRARTEAAALIAAAAEGTWPPAICHEWTLGRARATLSGGGTRGGTPV